MKKKGWFSVLQNLSWLTQLGLSLAAPPVLCLLGAGWLARRFSLGPWVYFAAIVLGLGAVACTFAEFVKMFRRKNSCPTACDHHQKLIRNLVSVLANKILINTRNTRFRVFTCHNISFIIQFYLII